MYRVPSIGFKRQIPFWTALVFFAVAAGYDCENRLVQNGISSLSLDQETLYMPLASIEFEAIGTKAFFAELPLQRLAGGGVYVGEGFAPAAVVVVAQKGGLAARAY